MSLENLMEQCAELAPLLTERRRQRIEEVLAWRTYHVTVVLEDIHQSQNASAAIRTCECYGIQRIFTIENSNPLTLNPDVVVGATNWVDVERFNKPGDINTTDCLSHLKDLGYRVVGTSPTSDAIDLRDLDIAAPTALLFGTELSGLSLEALRLSDQTVRLPMFGFTESFNISVSVALALSEIVPRLHDSNLNWRLSDEQRARLRLQWYERQIRR
jgi:tRNA (guanosine-2'-O-)-methyltransferase